ncbi:hypothetical protein SDJN02_11651, partial [Cucurbita argyrosperma subsp. argyrosperma]
MVGFNHYIRPSGMVGPFSVYPNRPPIDVGFRSCALLCDSISSGPHAAVLFSLSRHHAVVGLFLTPPPVPESPATLR